MPPETQTTFLDAIRNLIGAQESHPQEDEVRERAYLLWEEAGRPEGDGVEFWLRAEQDLTA